MVGQPEPENAPEIAAGHHPLTEVTRWGLVGDIRTLERIGRPTFEVGDCRIEVSKDGIMTFRERGSREVLYRLHRTALGNDTEFNVSMGTDSANRKPLDEEGAAFIREYLVEAIRFPEPPSSVELLNDEELREGIIKQTQDYLSGHEHAIIWTPSERYLHLFAQKKGVGISIEHPSLNGTEIVETEDIIVKPDKATSSLDLIAEEELDPEVRDKQDVGQQLAEESERTKAAQVMGFANREMSRSELQGLYIDLASGELEEPDEAESNPLD